MSEDAKTDRELLELAARAAGYEIVSSDERAPGIYIAIPETNRAPQRVCYWYPLVDDGDALRLAVKLNMDVCFDTAPDGPYVVAVCAWGDREDRNEVDLGKDAAAATRRAIVRCAALASAAAPDLERALAQKSEAR